MPVTLKILEKSDSARIATLANNKSIWDNVRDYFPHPYTAENAISFIEMIKECDTDHVFGIVCDNDLIGLVGMHELKDVYKNTAEVGYWIGEPYWGKGFATLAVQQIIDYAWKNTKIKRLEAGVFDYNMSSMRVLEKTGFIKEAILRNRILKNNKIHDEHLYAILRPIK